MSLDQTLHSNTMFITQSYSKFINKIGKLNFGSWDYHEIRFHRYGSININVNDSWNTFSFHI